MCRLPPFHRDLVELLLELLSFPHIELHRVFHCFYVLAAVSAHHRPRDKRVFILGERFGLISCLFFLLLWQFKWVKDNASHRRPVLRLHYHIYTSLFHVSARGLPNGHVIAVVDRMSQHR